MELYLFRRNVKEFGGLKVVKIKERLWLHTKFDHQLSMI